jgi:hypothetical protein
MLNTRDKRLFETIEYNQVHARNFEKTENSDEKRESGQRRLTNCSTRTVTENNSGIREETARQESSSTNQNMALDLNVIPAPSDSQNNGDELINENQFHNLSENRTRENRAISPNGQTPQTINNSKKIFEVTNGANTNISNTLETKHSRDTKDNQRIRVVRGFFKKINEFLNTRCQEKGLELKDVDVQKLFGNIQKQRWFLRRKIKILLASKPDNKKVIKKMMKDDDEIFKRFVELTFEDFCQKLFVKNNRYLPLDRNSSILLNHLKTFKNYLEEVRKKYNAKYANKLKETGNNLINEIKGGDFYLARCKRKRIMKAI